METGYPDNLLGISDLCLPRREERPLVFGPPCNPMDKETTVLLRELEKVIAKDKSVCQEADEIVSGERQGQYGNPVSNWNHIAEICTPLLKDVLKEGAKLTASHAVIFMIGVKMARQLHKHKRDSIVDACGYLKILNMIEEDKENNGKA